LHTGCHCHSLSLASVKSRLVLPFWYRLTWVVPDKGPLNGCSVVLLMIIILWGFYITSAIDSSYVSLTNLTKSSRYSSFHWWINARLARKSCVLSQICSYQSTLEMCSGKKYMYTTTAVLCSTILSTTG